jgi:putative N6-adenine-specific DNA methylase
MKFIAKTVEGLEGVLFREIENNHFKNPTILRRAVSFNGNMADLYKANYVLSTAIRILTPISYGKVKNEEQLYKLIYDIPWQRYFLPENTFRVDVTLLSEMFTNSLFLAQKTKDAIADRFRNELGKRPSVDIENPDIVINVHINDVEAAVLLDSSGQTLNRRGYRDFQGIAPINEVLARGLLLLSGWDSPKPLFDIMCGTGTIPIEATYMANKIPSGFLRNQYAFMNWQDFDEDIWKKIKEDENKQITDANIKIMGADVSHRIIHAAKKSVHLLPYSQSTLFFENDFFENSIPFEEGFVISNLPYNKRIEVENIREFYNNIGTKLKFNYKSNHVWLLMEKEQSKFLSLKPKKKIPLLNGKIACTFNEYELF